MHWVTNPSHSLPCSLNSLHQGWQLGSQLLLAHAHNDSQSARRVLRVEGVYHGDQVIGVHLVADLHPNGVANATHELHMRCIQLASALATPQEVTCICKLPLMQ
jgi:putative NIF3 family GTP cyclohydrolase 1 type 2